MPVKLSPSSPATPTQLLHTQLSDFLHTEVAPQANALDHDTSALKQALQGLAERGVLGAKVPPNWGGLGLSASDYRQWQLEIARYSGALAFLQSQHQSATSMLIQSPNVALQDRLLPAIANNHHLVGVGFSHLRRPGKPVVTAEPVASGYQLNGTVPWVTGLGYFQDFILGATLPDGQELYALLPLQTSQQPAGGRICFREPLALADLTATNTVTADLQDWWLTPEQVVSLKPAGDLHQKDQRSPLLNSFMTLGCARAGLDILALTCERQSLEQLHTTYTALLQQWQTCHAQILTTIAQGDAPTPTQLALRATAIQLAFSCSQAAIVATSGAANLATHAAQRIYREAIVFAVSGQTTALRAATLDKLHTAAQAVGAD
ncbi:MAG: acyl-CoA dehydrogenase family protein [Cyanobacteria bacterium P01_H01_bin.121]